MDLVDFCAKEISNPLLEIPFKFCETLDKIKIIILLKIQLKSQRKLWKATVHLGPYAFFFSSGPTPFHSSLNPSSVLLPEQAGPAQPNSYS